MARIPAYGLRSIMIGDPALDGGPGLTLVEVIGWTVPDSAVLTSTEPTVEDVPIEESAFPIGSIETEEGTFSLAFSTYNSEAELFAMLFGGAVVGGVWTATREGRPKVIKTVQVTTLGGETMTFPKMQLRPALDLAFAKSRYGQTNITGAVLLPDKEGVGPIIWDTNGD